MIKCISIRFATQSFPIILVVMRANEVNICLLPSNCTIFVHSLRSHKVCQMISRNYTQSKGVLGNSHVLIDQILFH